jgi:hypothetical protein
MTEASTEKYELINYNAMYRAIEAAYRVDEVEAIHDKAAAFEIYAKQAQNVEAERQACEIRLRGRTSSRRAPALDEKNRRAGRRRPS